MLKPIVRVLIVLIAAAPLIAAFQQPAYKPVATVGELMSSIVVPSSDVVFAAAGEKPRNDGEWAKVKSNAIILAESGNLLLMRAPASNNENWLKYSRALIDAGQTALKAANAKNVDALSDAGNDIYDTCDSCHKQYMKQ
jgi:hypothetical protein